MYLLTLLSAMLMPSLSSSPWMRGAPQVGFSRHILRIRSRTSWEMRGGPGRPQPLTPLTDQGSMCQREATGSSKEWRGIVSVRDLCVTSNFQGGCCHFVRPLQGGGKGLGRVRTTYPSTSNPRSARYGGPTPGGGDPPKGSQSNRRVCLSSCRCRLQVRLFS